MESAISIRLARPEAADLEGRTKSHGWEGRMAEANGRFGVLLLLCLLSGSI